MKCTRCSNKTDMIYQGSSLCGHCIKVFRLMDEWVMACENFSLTSEERTAKTKRITEEISKLANKKGIV